MPMTKQEAADYLGVTIRSIESYASKGKLTPAKARGTRGDITVYDQKELEQLKKNREQIQFVPRPEPATPTIPNPPTALARRRDVAEFFKMIESARAAAPTVADLAAKPLLKINEVQTLTGLSRETLREAIDKGRLKAKLIGRAYRIKRADLDEFIKKL